MADRGSTGTSDGNTEGIKHKKSVNIARKAKSKSSQGDWDLLPQVTGSKFLRQLNTCVPFYLEKDGYIINDLRDDYLQPSCSNSTQLSVRVPSDDYLSPTDCRNRHLVQNTISTGTSDQKLPYRVEHSLTVEEIQAGLQTMSRTSNGYGFTFEHLDISDKGLKDIAAVEEFSELRSIDISCNYIRDVRVLGAMPYLKIINASRNDIEIFGDFIIPVAVQQVNFSRNKIYRIVNLNKLWALTEVNLSHNYLEIVDGFEQCKHLRVLDLSYNRISNIRNLNCKCLIALFLHKNKIWKIMDLTKCKNLRALSLAHNQIEELEPLRNLTNLQELWLQSNKIMDIHELRNLKSLLNLVSLFVEPNPFNSLGLWRRMLIFTLPQLRLVDGNSISAEESLEAHNTFNPSLMKIAHESQMIVLLDRMCQSGTDIFDENIHSSMSLPPILLLVGAPMSYCFKLSTLLKEKFKSKIQLGGVHSTVTTFELPNTNKDIPVSYEAFDRMKNRGDFLAYSHILGRICGFATTQITHAAERNAVLVASVPIGIAITLRQWNIPLKAVLVMPTGKVDIPELPKLQGTSNNVPSTAPNNKRPSSPPTEDAEEVQRTGSYWEEKVDKQSGQKIGFQKGKTLFELDEPGLKQPNLEAGPPSGHTCLKSKDEKRDDFGDSANQYRILQGSGTADNAGQRKSRTSTVNTDQLEKVVVDGNLSPTTIEVEDSEVRFRFSERDSGPGRGLAGNEVVATGSVENVVPAPPPTDNIVSVPQQATNGVPEPRQEANQVPGPRRATNEAASPGPRRATNEASPPGPRRETNEASPPGPRRATNEASPRDPADHGIPFSTKTSNVGSSKTSEKVLPTSKHPTIRETTYDEVPDGDCTELKRTQFLTAPKDYPEFSTTRQLQTLRRIASLLMEVGDKEMIFEEITALGVGMNKEVDWKQALIELQTQELKSTEHAYNLLINRLGLNANKGTRYQQFFDACLQPPRLEDINSTRDGDFELVFIKDYPDSCAILNTKASRVICDDVQGRVIVEQIRSDPAAADSLTNEGLEMSNSPSRSTLSKQSRPATYLESPKKTYGSQSNFASQGMLSSIRNDSQIGTPMKPCPTEIPLCTTVVNPNYAFGPHEVCCEGDLHPICRPSDFERGTFYQGQFRRNFLSSSCSSSVSRSFTDCVWRGEYNEDEEGMFANEYSPMPFTSRKSSATQNEKARRTLEIQQLSDQEVPGEFDAAYPQSAPPPPSQNSCYGNCRTPIVEADELSSAESEVEINTNQEHTSRNHRKAIKTCILNEREKYKQFHRENPGFFATVINSEHLDSCVQVLSQMLEDMMRCDPKIPKFISYANENKIDEIDFMKQRMAEYRASAEGFSKGKPELLIKTLSTIPNKKPRGKTCVHSDSTKCPPDLLRPFISHRTRMTKIQKIVQS